MKIVDAYDIMEGKKSIDEVDLSVEEGMQLMMGACLTDEGDIWCLQCDRPNECCKCGMVEDFSLRD